MTSDGGSFTVTHTMQGGLRRCRHERDGTLAAHLTYIRGDGMQHECDSGSFAWSAQRQ
jgi:hypothetical protein